MKRVIKETPRGKLGNQITHVSNGTANAVIVTNYEIKEIFNKPLNK